MVILPLNDVNRFGDDNIQKANCFQSIIDNSDENNDVRRNYLSSSLLCPLSQTSHLPHRTTSTVLTLIS